MGNPRRAHDNTAIEEAARLGGAYELIARLSDGLDTYLERPVRNQYSGLPDELKKLFGRKVVSGSLGFLDETLNQGLSGGQMQRLAVARTFMRSSTMEQEVGLLLFDEPSASLDPAAEHGTVNICLMSDFLFNTESPTFLELFSRLRKLRGNKTMIFSTHRFGNLTRHADLIVCVSAGIFLASPDLTRYRR